MKSVTRWFVLAAAALGLAVGSVGRAEAGQVLYASFDNGTIERFDLATGQDLGTFASGLSRPEGLAFDTAGNLFVANGGDGTISKITPGGTVSTFATGFQVPTGLAFDSAGNLYVANYGGEVTRSTSISEITPDGTVSTFASVSMNGYYGPNGLAFDKSGNLYTSVSRSDNVLKVAPDGTVSIFVPGPNTGKLDWPTGLAFDKSGNLYTVNAVYNPWIAKITPGGTVSLFAQGTGLSNPGVTPGPNAGLAFDASGNLFAASFRNYLTIDEITPDGTVSTFASGLSSSPRFLAIRDESSAAVPEPATLVQAVIGVALLGLVAWVRRLREPA